MGEDGTAATRSTSAPLGTRGGQIKLPLPFLPMPRSSAAVLTAVLSEWLSSTINLILSFAGIVFLLKVHSTIVTDVAGNIF